MATVLASGIADADINVVAVYEGQAEYALAAHQADNPDLEALAKEHIVRPYLDACWQGLSAEERAENAVSMGTPFSDIETLTASVHELRRMEIAENVEEYLRQASELLPLAADQDVTLCIKARDPAQMSDQPFIRDVVKGVGGQYFGNGNIWMGIHPYPGWFEQAKYVAPHEYHHLVRDVPESGTLLEEIIDEGLADAFVRQLFGGWTPDSFSASSLDRQEERRIWNEMTAYLSSDDRETVRRFKFGSVYGADDLPPIPGYTIGRNIVYAFLEKEPDVPLDVWSHLPAEKIYAKSGYGDGGGVAESFAPPKTVTGQE